MADPGFLKHDTLALHAGQTIDPVTGSRATPIYQTTAYVFDDSDQAAARFNLEQGGHIYVRLSNPTVAVLEERAAALHNGVGAVATSSGHAALHMIVATLCSAGDHIVASRAVYGGSVNFLGQTMPRFGVTTTFVDPTNLEEIEAAIQPNTKFLFGEVVGNPGLDVMDVEAVSKIAQKHSLPLVIDNTFLTPSLFRPLDHGADIVMESATKWIGGHGVALGGLIIDAGRFDWTAPGSERSYPTMTDPYPGYNNIVFADAFGAGALIARIRAEGLRDFGCTLSPQNAFYLLQGMETLPLRMKKHMENTRVLLDWLKDHELVSWIRHPELESHPQHEIAKSLLTEGASPMIVFGLKGGREAGKKFIDSVELLSHVANVGDAKTLVTHPASTTHMQVGEETLKALGVGVDMIRLSVGLEDPADIIRDLGQAMKRSQK